MGKLWFASMLLPWVFLITFFVGWDNRWVDNTYITGPNNDLYEIDWWTTSNERCAYMYTYNNITTAVIEYQWSVPSEDFPTRDSAAKWIERVCGGQHYAGE
jgi:hypothetical protein